MHRKIFPAIALALVAGIVGWILWPDANSHLAVDAGQGSNPAQEQHEAASDAHEIPAAVAEKARVENAPADPKSELADALPPYSGSDAISIIVTDGTTGQRVPQADVYLSDFAGLRKHTKDFAQRSGVSGKNQKLRRHGQHYQTDDAGVALVPPGTKPPLILAEKDGGYAYVQKPKIVDHTISLQLQPNQQLTITVVDTLGEVAPNFPVALLEEIPGRSRFLLTLYTDQYGQVVLEDLGPYFAPSRGDFTIHAALGIPMNPELQAWPQKVQITPQLIKQKNVTLALPPLGKVKLTIRDKQGKISSEAGFGRIYFPMFEENQYSSNEVHLNAKVIDGVALFEGVALNTPLAAMFYCISSPNRDLVLFDGPSSPDSVLEIELIIH
jgi:hypothetical protein